MKIAITLSRDRNLRDSRTKYYVLYPTFSNLSVARVLITSLTVTMTVCDYIVEWINYRPYTLNLFLQSFLFITFNLFTELLHF